MRYDLNEIILATKMGGLPVILVEGSYDVKFYENLVKLNGLNVDILAVDNIPEYSEGCKAVCKALQEFERIINESDESLEPYLMGIIDGDARKYTNEIPQITNLLILRCYSFETHLITQQGLKNVVSTTTSAAKIIDDKLFGALNSRFVQLRRMLYYCSLDALKHKCEPNYKGVVTYSDDFVKSIGTPQKSIWEKVEKRINLLDEFAEDKNISIDNLREIAKGKWYLHVWGSFLLYEIKNLFKLCGQEITECQFCRAGNKSKCEWKASGQINIPIMESILKQEKNIDLEETGYIVEYIKEHLAV